MLPVELILGKRHGRRHDVHDVGPLYYHTVDDTAGTHACCAIFGAQVSNDIDGMYGDGIIR